MHPFLLSQPSQMQLGLRLILGLASASVVLTTITPAFTIRWDWRDALFDLLGLCCIIGGTLLVPMAHEKTEWQGPRSPLVGMLAVCIGVEFLIAGSAQSVLWMILFLAIIGWPHFQSKLCFDQSDYLLVFSSWRTNAKRCVMSRGTLLCGVIALAIIAEMLQAAFSKGGPKAHSVELGTFGILLSLVGVGWAAARDALQIFARKGQQLVRSPYAIISANFVKLSLVFFGFFSLLALGIQLPTIQKFDTAFGRMSYKCWGEPATQVIRQISNAGGSDLASIWIPVILFLLALLGRFRALRFFIAVMCGTLGLETLFKGLSHRLRPEFTRGTHFDSFPSGHALAATVLAGLLLFLLLPGCRQSWQRVGLWGSAIAWPLLMALSRVYTGRHYLSDVVGSLLLGIAWISFCSGLYFWLTDAGFGNNGSPAASRVEYQEG